MAIFMKTNVQKFCSKGCGGLYFIELVESGVQSLGPPGKTHPLVHLHLYHVHEIIEQIAAIVRARR